MQNLFRECFQGLRNSDNFAFQDFNMALIIPITCQALLITWNCWKLFDRTYLRNLIRFLSFVVRVVTERYPLFLRVSYKIKRCFLSFILC